MMNPTERTLLRSLVVKHGFASLLTNLQVLADDWANTSEDADIRAYYKSVAGGLEEGAAELGSGLV